MVNLSASCEQGAAVVVVSGEIDASNASDLGGLIKSALRAQPLTLDIDCTGLTFIDSSGIAELIRAWRFTASSASRTDLYVNGINGSPARTLELLGINFLPSR